MMCQRMGWSPIGTMGLGRNSVSSFARGRAEGGQGMKSAVTTTIPVRNAQRFVRETLESVAGQTRRPDRVVVLYNCSTDDTPQIVQGFKGLPIEYIRNPRDLGPFGNFNRCLDFAAETEYLQILHGDDLIGPEFYEIMT